MNELERHQNHPFYKEADGYRDSIREQQIEKGAMKYPEPLNPDSWTCDQLANHAMQENVDQSYYIYAMKVRMKQLEEENKQLRERLDEREDLSR